jgi:hypothetical protein
MLLPCHAKPQLPKPDKWSERLQGGLTTEVDSLHVGESWEFLHQQLHLRAGQRHPTFTFAPPAILPVVGASFGGSRSIKAHVGPEVEFIWTVLDQQQARDVLSVRLLGRSRHYSQC